MASAERQAFLACSGSSKGAFQNAMMQSPIYLSMVPLPSRMMSVIGVRNLLMNRVSSSASNFSEIVVKSRISQNSIVMGFISPPRVSFSGWAASCSTTAGDR